MLKHVKSRVIPVALVTTSLALGACNGGTEEEMDTDGQTETSGELDTGAALPDNTDGDSNSDTEDNDTDTGNNQSANGNGNSGTGDNQSGNDNGTGTDDNQSGNDNNSADTGTDSESTPSVDTGSTDGNTDNNDNNQDTDDSADVDTGADVDADTDADADADAGGTPDDIENDTGSTTDDDEIFAKDIPPGFSGASASVVTPSQSDPFSKFQLDNSLYTNNVYDGRQLDPDNNWKLIFYDGVQDFVRWEVPALIENQTSPCVRPHSGEPVMLSYRLTSRKDSPHERNTFVRSYPAMVVGSMGGRYESWGVECGQIDAILPSVQRHGGSPVYQMETAAAATGLPALAGDLDYDIRVSVQADLTTESASNGLANVFMDSYWHNVSDIDLVPGNTAELVDTINGISSDYTEVWNLNIWFDYPRVEGSASSWTGGFKIGSVTLQEGGVFDVYFKIEGSRDGHLPRCRLGGSENCFLYIGLVATDDDAARNGITINYTEIAQWMKSADFRDLFLTGAFETDTPAAKAFAAWQLIDGTDNDNHPDPAKRGPRFPDDLHVVGGIHLGAELWYNPDAVAATIEFEALGVEVEGFGQFGNYRDFE